MLFAAVPSVSVLSAYITLMTSVAIPVNTRFVAGFTEVANCPIWLPGTIGGNAT